MLPEERRSNRITPVAITYQQKCVIDQRVEESGLRYSDFVRIMLTEGYHPKLCKKHNGFWDQKAVDYWIDKGVLDPGSSIVKKMRGIIEDDNR